MVKMCLEIEKTLPRDFLIFSAIRFSNNGVRVSVDFLIATKKKKKKFAIRESFHKLVYMITHKEIENAIDFLMQANYNANRKLGESSARLALIFGKEKAALLENNFNKNLTPTEKTQNSKP